MKNCMKMLVVLGAVFVGTVQVKAKKGNATALHEIIYQSCEQDDCDRELEHAKFLLGLRANVEALDGRERTPLMHAAFKGCSAEVRFLVREGKANINTMNRFEESAFQLAMDEGYEEVAEWLACSAVISEAVARTIGRQERAVGKAMMSAAIMKTLRDNNFTPLTYLAFGGYLQGIKYLICEGKAHINEVDGRGETALQVAKKRGHMRIVAYLRSMGAYEPDEVGACAVGFSVLGIGEEEKE